MGVDDHYCSVAWWSHRRSSRARYFGGDRCVVVGGGGSLGYGGGDGGVDHLKYFSDSRGGGYVAGARYGDGVGWRVTG